MSPFAAPADKRFHRAHVKPGRRRRWWTVIIPLAKYSVLLALTMYALYRGGSVVAHARVLQIDQIVVSGNEQLSTGEVLAVLGSLRGQSILWSDLDVWRQRLLSSSWVKDAAFRRLLPSTVEVVVREREPIGLCRIHGGLYLVDDHGVIIDEYGPPYADFDLPIVDGLSAAQSDAGATTDEARAELASRVIVSLRSKPEVAGRLSQIDVSDLRNAAVILSGDPAVIYVGDDRFLPRLQSYLELAPALKAQVPDIDYVDLRFDPRIIVRPAKRTRGGTSAVAAGRGASANSGGASGTKKKS